MDLQWGKIRGKISVVHDSQYHDLPKSQCRQNDRYAEAQTLSGYPMFSNVDIADAFFFFHFLHGKRFTP